MATMRRCLHTDRKQLATESIYDLAKGLLSSLALERQVTDVSHAEFRSKNYTFNSILDRKTAYHFLWRIVWVALS